MREDGPSKRVAFRWDMSLTQVVRCCMTFQEIITETIKSPSNGTLRCGTQASRSMGPDSKGFKFRGAGCRLAAMKQPRAGSVLEPVRPETAGRALPNLTSRTTTSEPDERSWDFDRCKSTSARNRTRRSPMLTHETSPVLGASVMGMTIWVGQGQSHLPADVPGITMALGQRGRLQPKAGCASSRLTTSPSEA
jgi:hypothetical protein